MAGYNQADPMFTEPPKEHKWGMKKKVITNPAHRQSRMEVEWNIITDFGNEPHHILLKHVQDPQSLQTQREVYLDGDQVVNECSTDCKFELDIGSDEIDVVITHNGQNQAPTRYDYFLYINEAEYHEKCNVISKNTGGMRQTLRSKDISPSELKKKDKARYDARNHLVVEEQKQKKKKVRKKGDKYGKAKPMKKKGLKKKKSGNQWFNDSFGKKKKNKNKRQNQPQQRNNNYNQQQQQQPMHLQNDESGSNWNNGPPQQQQQWGNQPQQQQQYGAQQPQFGQQGNQGPMQPHRQQQDDDSDYETASDEDQNQQFNMGGAQGQPPPQQPSYDNQQGHNNNNPQQQYQQGPQQSFYGQQQGGNPQGYNNNNNPQQQYQQSPQQSFYGQQQQQQFYGQPPPGPPQQQQFPPSPQQQYQQSPQNQPQSFYGQQNPQQQQPFYGRQPRGPPPNNNAMPNQMGYGMNAQPQQGGYQSEPLTPKPVTPQIPAIRAVPVPSHPVNYTNTQNHPYCPSNMRYPYGHVYPQNAVPQLPTQHEEKRRSWNEDSASPDIAEMSPEMRPLSEHSSDTDSMNMYMHMQNSVFCPSIVDLESDENDKKRKRNDDVCDNDTVPPSKKRRLN
eukprot:392426_1